MGDAQTCWLCARPLGTLVQWHHIIPKSRGGRETAAIHPLCHSTIHATFTNAELERRFADAEAIRAHPDIARFIGWVTRKPPDFRAPVRRKQA